MNDEGMEERRRIREAADRAERKSAVKPKKIIESNVTEIWAVDELRNYRSPKIMTHYREALEPEALYAMALIEKWGLVMGAPAGEDSAGRAMVGLMPVEDIVQRGFDVARLAYSEAGKRGLVLTLPSYADLAEAGDADG